MTGLLNQCLDNLPRLASCGDWNSASPTYGCWDRAYWHYKLSDFPSAPLQSAVLPLALLYAAELPGNFLFGNPKALAMLKASCAFWARCAGRGGSWDEWYPHEGSFVATAFTAYAVSQALLSSREHWDSGEVEPLLRALRSAGGFLARHRDPISNHSAGALAALHNIAQLLPGEDWARQLERKRAALLKAQHPEGWWPEYQGADLGYLSLTLDYLAKYYHASGDDAVLPALERALKFMTPFAAPDGSWGGDWTSRGTRYLMPHGLALLAGRFGSAQFLLQHFLQGIASGTLPRLSHFDERYLVFFFYPNYLQAALSPGSAPSGVQPGSGAREHHFPGCGLWVKRAPGYWAVSGISQGGALKVVDRQSSKLAWADSGYWALLPQGSATTLYLQLQDDYDFQQGAGWTRFSFKRPFKLLPGLRPTPWRFLLLRSFNLTLGACPWGAALLRAWLQKTSLSPSRELPLTLQREAFWDDTGMVLKDILTRRAPLELSRLRLESAHNWLHSPTGRFPLASDFQTFAFPDVAQALSRAPSVMLTYTLRFAPEYNMTVEVR